MFKVNNENTRTTYDVVLVSLLLALNIISYFLVFVLLTLNEKILAGIGLNLHITDFNDTFEIEAIFWDWGYLEAILF